MLAFMPSAPVKSERRKKLRKKPLRLVYVELAFGNGGMMRDLSEEGFAVRAMMPMKQGDKTPFSFLLGDATRIEGEGKVLWIDEGGRVAGVEFTQIPAEMKSQIDDWLIEDEKITSPRETAKEPAIAPASSMEALREEMRSTPARTEAAAPAVEERAPVHEPPPVKVEAPKIPEPKIEEIPPAKPEVKIAAREQIAEKKEIAAKREPTPAPEPEPPKPAPPKVFTEPSAPPVSSITEGFFRKWPNAPRSSAPAAETHPPDSPSLPLLARVAAPPRSEDRVFEETEEPEDRTETRAPRPDISEILIQPRGGSPQADAAVRPLPELHEVPHAGPVDWEWFTLGRAVLAMGVLTLLAGFFVFHRAVGRGFIWLGEAMGGTTSSSNNTGSTPSAKGGDTDNSAPAGEADASQPMRPENVVRTPTIAAPGAANGTPSLSSAPKSTSAPVTPLSSPGGSPDSGQSEYLQAVELMRGRNSGNDTAEAARLLWIAVEKGNPGAEAMLADLYWHGQGVVRNCDQARILFTAAARKGSSEAQKRLQRFQQEGCE